VDVGAAFVAEPEPAVLVQPGERPLGHPALLPEPGAVPGALMRDNRPDLARAQPGFGRFGVVAAVAEQRAGTAPRPTRLAAHGGDRLHEREQVREVVPAGAAEKAGERDAGGVGDQVVLAAGLAPVDRAGAGFGAPKTAGT